jgi:hypothetical protein
MDKVPEADRQQPAADAGRYTARMAYRNEESMDNG